MTFANSPVKWIARDQRWVGWIRLPCNRHMFTAIIILNKLPSECGHGWQVKRTGQERSTLHWICVQSKRGSFINRDSKNVFHFYLLLLWPRLSVQLNEARRHCDRIIAEMFFTFVRYSTRVLWSVLHMSFLVSQPNDHRGRNWGLPHLHFSLRNH